MGACYDSLSKRPNVQAEIDRIILLQELNRPLTHWSYREFGPQGFDECVTDIGQCMDWTRGHPDLQDGAFAVGLLPGKMQFRLPDFRHALPDARERLDHLREVYAYNVTRTDQTKQTPDPTDSVMSRRELPNSLMHYGLGLFADVDKLVEVETNRYAYNVLGARDRAIVDRLLALGLKLEVPEPLHGAATPRALAAARSR